MCAVPGLRVHDARHGGVPRLPRATLRGLRDRVVTTREYVTHNVVLNVLNLAYNAFRAFVFLVYWALDR